MAENVAKMTHLERKVGVPILYDPNCPGVAYARGIWPFKRITVGKLWHLLPAHEQDAIVAHEAGHCERLHMEARWLLLPFCWTKWAQRIAREHEFAADAYAVRHGHGFGMLRFIQRARRVAANDEMAALICPSPEERESRVLQLLQERHR